MVYVLSLGFFSGLNLDRFFVPVQYNSTIHLLYQTIPLHSTQ